jgi:hypothetical protein
LSSISFVDDATFATVTDFFFTAGFVRIFFGGINRDSSSFGGALGFSSEQSSSSLCSSGGGITSGGFDASFGFSSIYLVGCPVKYRTIEAILTNKVPAIFLPVVRFDKIVPIDSFKLHSPSLAFFDEVVKKDYLH